MEIPLSRNIKVNEGSSLRREHYAYNDPNIPVQITGAPKVDVSYSDRRFSYSSAVSITVTEPIVAIEVITMTIDVWGEHGTNLSNTEIQDFDAGEHTIKGTWNVFRESDAMEFWASVAFVKGVRTASGAVYTADSNAVLEQANKIGARLTTADFQEEDR